MSEPASTPTRSASRRPFNLLAFLWLGLATPLYAFLAANNPLLGQSAVTVIALSTLFVLASVFVLSSPNPDRLDPFRIVSAVFLLVYCIAPLWMQSFEWNIEGDVGTLLSRSTRFVLLAFLVIAAGYHLPIFSRFPRRSPPATGRPLPSLRLYALALFGVGLVFYVALVLSAGGVRELIGSGESRVDFTKGVGYLLHGSLFLLSGAGLYFAARTSPEGRFRLGMIVPLLSAAGLLLLLQNRSRVLWALAILAFVYHYRVAPISIRRLAVYGSIVFVLFVFIGHARHPSIRPHLLTSPWAVFTGILLDFDLAVEILFGSTLNRLQQVVLVFDNFPRLVPHEWGTTLLAFFNPLTRLVGLEGLQVESLGTRLFQLAQPEFPLWVQTGYHPSMIGEMLVNFPWYLALLGVFLYGIALRLLYQRLVISRGDPISIALYAIVLFRVVDMVIVGVGQLVFSILVVAIPIWLARVVAPSPRRLRGTAREDLPRSLASPS